MLKKTLSIALSFLLISFFTHAELNSISVGPKIGSTAPEISTIDSYGQATKLSNIAKDKGTILIFFRSADWCPYCKRHLIELNQMVDKFFDLGYGVAGISYDDPKVLSQFKKERYIKFDLLADQKVKTVKAYRILNKQYKPSDDHYGIPYPGVVVIDKKGKVVHKYFYEGYKKRVKFNDLYNQLATTAP